MSKIFIGTSGWSYLHWKGVFYPKELSSAKFLNYYTKKFKSVEINSSFYHLPGVQILKNWYQNTPKKFLFSLKASRFISHRKKLKDCLRAWNLFYSQTKFLKEKLGPILFQLPANFKENQNRLKNFLKLLPGRQKFTFEFRHPSWFNKSTYQLLKEHNIALTIADSPIFPYHEEITSNFTYLRLHGHKQLYNSNYEESYLKKLAKAIKKWIINFNLKAVYIYFDNDAQGFAPQNAFKLKKIFKSI